MRNRDRVRRHAVRPDPAGSVGQTPRWFKRRHRFPHRASRGRRTRHGGARPVRKCPGLPATLPAGLTPSACCIAPRQGNSVPRVEAHVLRCACAAVASASGLVLWRPATGSVWQKGGKRHETARRPPGPVLTAPGPFPPSPAARVPVPVRALFDILPCHSPSLGKTVSGSTVWCHGANVALIRRAPPAGDARPALYAGQTRLCGRVVNRPVPGSRVGCPACAGRCGAQRP